MAHLFAGGIIKFTPFSRPPIDDINVDIVLKPGTHEDITERHLRHFSEQIWELHQELLAKGTIQDSIIAKVNMSVGSSSDRITTGSHAGSVGVEFENLDENNISGLQLGGMIREKIGNVPEAEKFTIGAANFWGKPVSISLKSKNIEDLEKMKTEIKEVMGGMSDLRDITDNASAGQRELELELKPLAYHLGLTHEDITRQIRQGFLPLPPI